MFLTDICVEERSVLEVITYLRNRYYKITATEILHNDQTLRELWDVEEPIEAYFKKVKEYVKICQ